MKKLWPLALLLLGACRYTYLNDLDGLEARLALTPAQKPAWETFRKEAARAQARWSGPEAPGLTELRQALLAPVFDKARADQAAGWAARQGGQDARALIDAWNKVDSLLTTGQRRELRRAPPF